MTKVGLQQLRHYQLERQGLVERFPLSELPMRGPLHATDHTTPYLSALARTDLSSWEAFADLYYDHHAFTRLRCMRGTLHLVPEAQVETVQCAYRINDHEPFPEFAEFGISLEQATELRFHILEALEREGPQTSASLRYHVPQKWSEKLVSKAGRESSAIGPVLRWLWMMGLVESGIGVGNWRHKDNHFRIATQGISGCDPALADQELARWYFSLYGPAAYEDWAWWSGLPASRCRPAFDAIQPTLTEVQVEGLTASLWMPHTEANRLLNTPPEAPVMVRLLPYEDALLKAYKLTRERFYDPDGLAENIVFTRGGEATPSIWVDGHIIGVWTWVKKPNEPMTIEPFVQMTKTLRRRLKPEIERLQQFVEASHILWAD